jgi:hypothetical protein
MLDKLRHHWNVSSRREFFTQAGSGLAAIALAAMLDQDGYAATAIDPLAPKKPHITPRAKSIIWCFMEGAPSHVDLFDPKPALVKYAGQPVPPSFHPETLQSAFGTLSSSTVKAAFGFPIGCRTLPSMRTRSLCFAPARLTASIM